MAEHVGSVTLTARPAVRGQVSAVVGPIASAGVVAGLGGGLVMIGLMTLVMGLSGAGWATPLNLGMAAFVFTITPPVAMLPSLAGLMGLHLPPSATAMHAPVAKGGHLAPAMMAKLQTMLMSMHLPAATVAALGALMSGHASNAQVVTLMQSMSPSAQTMVMAQMPVVGSQVIVGAILHFAFAAFIGLVFAGLIAAAAWLNFPGLRTSAGVIISGVIGGALLYVVLRWGILPPVNPMMGLVPQGWFFLAHLLYGLVVGIVLVVALRRPSVRAAFPAAG